MDWKVGDWVVYDLRVGQITKIREEWYTFSDGVIETSGRLNNQFRPLTLDNKVIVEGFKSIYDDLHKIDGSGGFNWPDISSYFSTLALHAIDSKESKKYFDMASEFYRSAKEYVKIIQGIKLFRPSGK